MSVQQVEETVGFEEDEDPMLEVSDEEQELTEAELAAGAEALPEEAALAFTEVRVVGGENMMEEHPVTEGLALFDTGVKVSILNVKMKDFQDLIFQEI